jgi:hypothetical protein
VFQTIGEPIVVAGVYQSFHFIPKKFKWGSREYLIDEITLISNIKDGGVKKRLYSVLSGPNLYRLEFNRETEQWLLQEIWCE